MARLLAIGLAVLAAAGCANILGIDHDYGDRPDDQSASEAGAGGAGDTAAAGTTGDGHSGGKSSTGGRSSDAGSGPGPSDGGAGQGPEGTGGSGPGGASFDAGSGPGGTGGNSGRTGGSGPGGTGGRANAGGTGGDRGSSGGSGPGGADGDTGGSVTGGASTGGRGTGGAVTGGSDAGGAGGTGTGGAATGGASSSGGAAGSTGSGGVPAAIKKVQSDSTTIAAESTSVQVTIDSIDPSKAFLVFGTRFDSASPGLTEVSGQISSDSQLTFMHETATAAPDIPIHYYVAEFDSGVTVQRGSHPMATTSETITLPASVDLATSFPIISFRNTGSMYSLDDFVRAKLTSTTELSLSMSESVGGGTVEWQVVSFDRAAVQTADVDIPSGTAVFSATLAEPVDPARTWLLLSYQVTDVSGAASELMLRGRVSSSTQLTFERSDAQLTSGGLLSYYAVSFSDGVSVQSGTSTLSSLATDTVALGSAVDPTKAIAAAGGIYQRGASTSYITDTNTGHGTFTLDLGTGTELSVARAPATSDASVDYYVVEFP